MSTLSAVISRKLAEEIIAGNLPPGTKLDEQTLAARFEVSRSPVRDALRQLATTRLVDFRPRRGFSVAVIDVHGLHDMFEAVSELEALCARLCALRAGAAERMALQRIHEQAAAAVARGDSAEYGRLNDAFHQAIYSAARSQTLERLTSELRQRLKAFRSRVFIEQGDRMRASLAEHDLVTQAIVRGDADVAWAEMRRHAASSAINITEYFRQSAADPARTAVTPVRIRPAAERTVAAALKRTQNV
jgi:DNA-binding GntR family transcriptional regulator